MPALEVYDATGVNKGKAIDYADSRKGKPTAVVIVCVRAQLPPAFPLP